VPEEQPVPINEPIDEALLNIMRPELLAEPVAAHAGARRSRRRSCMAYLTILKGRPGPDDPLSCPSRAARRSSNSDASRTFMLSSKIARAAPRRTLGGAPGFCSSSKVLTASREPAVSTPEVGQGDSRASRIGKRLG
jgi:hypothetical protein